MKAGRDNFRQDAAWAAIAAVVVAFAHLPFALLGGPFQDGWLHALLFERHDQAAILRNVLENGRPVAAYINLWSMSVFDSTRAPVWLSVFFLALAAFGWMLALLRTGRFGAWLAFAMTVIAVVSPGNQTIIGIPTVIWTVAYAAWALGLWLFVEASRREGVLAVSLRAGACLLAVLAATAGEVLSLLLALYPVFAVLAGPGSPPVDLRHWRSWTGPVLRQSLPAVIGIAAFAAMFIAYPPLTASFAVERRISFSPLLLAVSAATFAVAMMLAYLPLWAVGARLVVLRRRAGGAPAGAGFWLVLAAVSTLLVLGPYVASLRLATPVGFGARYLFYAGAGLALGVAALALPGTGKTLTLERRAALWIVAAMVLGLWVRWPFFAARTVHEQVIAHAIAASPVARQAHVLVVDDRTEVMGGPLRPYEWTGLAQRALVRPGAVAAMAVPVEPETALSALKLALRRQMGWAAAEVPQLTPQYMREQLGLLVLTGSVSDFDKAACSVARVQIDAPPGWGALYGLQWYFRGRLGDGAALQAWLAAQAVARVRIEPMAPLQPCL